jgi:uridine kinase
MKTKVIGALILRVAIILSITPKYSSEFFVPFLTQTHFYFDNWSEWINSSGDIRAFPYGLAMMIVYTPSLLIFEALQILSFDSARLLEITIAFQLLAVEGLLWRFIHKNKAMKESLNIFLFSPLLIWVNYFLGLNDLFPSAVLFLAAYLLLNRKYKSAGVLMGIAIGMKFSLALVLPFLILFAWDNPRFGRKIWSTSLFAGGVGLIMYIPGIYSSGFREMVFNNKESVKALEYTLIFANNRLLILPVIYLLLMYWLWKAGRISIEVLIAFFGIALFLISAFSPASLGWMLWGLPLMFMNLAKERRSRLQLLLIQSLFLLHSFSGGFEIQGVFGSLKIEGTNDVIRDLLFTLGVVLVVIYSYSSLRIAILHGDRYKIAVAPLTVSIAGDSGTGKDTLAQSLTKMFTPNTATVLCGDDYHKYERGDISWKDITHLNPAANYLDLWERDYKLAYRREYFEQREYDHHSGKFSQLKPRFRRDILISQGLHGLFPRVSEKSDLKIFLSMDEDLRIKLKVARDADTRGQRYDAILKSIRTRQKDYQSYILPQIENCDLHFHLYEKSGEISLRVVSRSTYLIERFMLTTGTSLEFSASESHDHGSKIYDINPKSIDGKSFVSVLRIHLTDYDQLFLEEPEIPSGALGIMVTLSILMLASSRGIH